MPTVYSPNSLAPLERELHQLRAKLAVLEGRDQHVRAMLVRAGENPDRDGILPALRSLIERAQAEKNYSEAIEALGARGM